MQSTGQVAQAEGGAFRPEIEGMRAVAALLVAIFHIWVRHPSGGVDVFFVVSGFLITTGLLKQVERTGQVHFARSWARLIKRLWPPALLVLGVVVIASVLLLPKSRWRETITDVAAAALYLENWRQADHATFTPVLHYWALSTQGQFYVMWPILIAGIAWLARRAGYGLRATANAVLAVIFTVSFVYSIVATADDQYFAYNNTFARVWEFSIGALLALNIHRIRLPVGTRVALGWIGLLAIVTCGALLPVATEFPGYLALWPTLAGAFVMIAGTTGSRFGADRLLASRPLVFLGGISYSLYLWHYPILIFCDRLLSPKTLSNVDGVLILAASLVLAWATSRLVEAPIRRSTIGKERPSHVFALGVAAMVPLFIALGAWTFALQQARKQERALMASTRHSPGALALEDGYAATAVPNEANAPIVPGPLSVAEDRETLRGAQCTPEADPTEPALCSVGAAQGTHTLVLVGGSHSAQWLPALRAIALQSGWRLFTYARTSCAFDRGIQSSDDDDDEGFEDCQHYNDTVMKHIRRLRPDAVLTSATDLTDEGDEVVPPGYVSAWEEVAQAGIKVIALRHNPSFGFDTTACVELHGVGSPECSVPRAEALDEPSPVERLAHVPPNVRFLDLSDYFCDDRTCYPVVGNVMVYRNLDHLTATYARTLAPILRREILRIFATSPAPAKKIKT